MKKKNNFLFPATKKNKIEGIRQKKKGFRWSNTQNRRRAEEGVEMGSVKAVAVIAGNNNSVHGSLQFVQDSKGILSPL